MTTHGPGNRGGDGPDDEGLDAVLREYAGRWRADQPPSPRVDFDRLAARRHWSDRQLWLMAASVAGVAAVVLIVALVRLSVGDRGSPQPTPPVALGPSATTSPSAPATAATTSPSETPSPVPTSPTQTPSHSVVGAPNGPLPVRFQPASLTFVSSDMGWLLGTASCAGAPCTALIRTTDDTQSWYGVPAPPAPLAQTSGPAGPPTNAVSYVRFADPLNGWAFGPGLWATHDGARTWHQLDVGGAVIALSASAGEVYALSAHCQTREQCSTVELLRAPATSDEFGSVLTAPANGLTAASELEDHLVLHGQAGWLFTPGSGGAATLYGTRDGLTWSTLPDPCADAQDSAGARLPLTSLTAATDLRLFALCSGDGAAGSSSKQVQASSDGGQSWTSAGQPPRSGIGGTIAAASTDTVAVASRSGASYLYLLTAGDPTWGTVAEFADGGAGLYDLGFTTPTQGAVIEGRPLPGATPAEPARLLLTRDGGRTWTPVTIH